MNLSKRARLGAKYLDETDPDWVDHIDTDRLDLKSVSSCVLGQRFGMYYDATDHLELTHIEAINLGFNLDVETEDKPHLWSGLTEAWIYEINKRRPVSRIVVTFPHGQGEQASEFFDAIAVLTGKPGMGDAVAELIEQDA